jgi:hypothetical protein
MRRIFLLTVYTIGLACGLAAQASFLNAYDLASYDPYLAAMPSTGGYLMTGKSVQPNNTAPLHFLRLDANGQVQGGVALSSSQSDPLLFSLTALADGRFVASGYDFQPPNLLAMTVELDANGQPLRVQRLQRNPAPAAYWGDVLALPDSGYLAMGLGQTTTYTAAMAARFDAQGDTLWTRLFGNVGEATEFTAAVQLPQGDFLMAGISARESASLERLLLQRIAPDGSLRWSKRYATGSRSVRPEGIVLQGGTAYLSFTSEDTATLVSHAGMLAMDTSGSVQWATLLTGQDNSVAEDITLTPNGRPVLVGGYFPGPGPSNIGLSAAFSATGSLLWSNGYENSGIGYSILPVPGGYLIGIVDPDSPNGLFLARTGLQGQLGGSCTTVDPVWTATPMTITPQPYNVLVAAGCQLSTVNLATPSITITNTVVCAGLVDVATALEPLGVSIAPHPMRSSARLQLPASFDHEGAVLTVHDLAGRNVDMGSEVVANGFQIHRQGLPAGLYSYQILYGGLRIASGKLMVTD